MKQIFCYLSCLVFLVLTACTEPITVGSDLLSGDRAELGQTVDVPFTTRVVLDDSLLVYDQSVNQAARFSFGGTEDDVFGKWSSSFYVAPTVPLNTASLPSIPPFAFTTDRTVDSVVLIIPIDTTYGFYGPGRAFEYQARLIDGQVGRTVDYYSDVEFPLDETLGNVNRDNSFIGTLNPSFIYDTTYNPIATRDSIAHFRMAFNDAFLDRVNAATESTFDGNDSLSSLLAGVFIEPIGNPDALLALSPSATATTSGFYFFYKDTSAAQTPRFFRVPLSLWPPNYKKDYTGSLTGELLADGDDRERLAISGQAGTMVEIEFTDLEALENKVINKAEVVFFRELVEGYSYDTYPAPGFVGLYYKDDNGDLQPITDEDVAFGPDALAFLGGEELFDENNDTFYRPRFSVHLQRMISGDVPPIIYMRVLPPDRDASRVILAGPDAAVRPASVKVTFTEIGG